jgi:hypothetical protein
MLSDHALKQSTIHWTVHRNARISENSPGCAYLRRANRLQSNALGRGKTSAVCGFSSGPGGESATWN